MFNADCQCEFRILRWQNGHVSSVQGSESRQYHMSSPPSFGTPLAVKPTPSYTHPADLLRSVKLLDIVHRWLPGLCDSGAKVCSCISFQIAICDAVKCALLLKHYFFQLTQLHIFRPLLQSVKTRYIWKRIPERTSSASHATGMNASYQTSLRDVCSNCYSKCKTVF